MSFWSNLTGHQVIAFRRALGETSVLSWYNGAEAHFMERDGVSLVAYLYVDGSLKVEGGRGWNLSGNHPEARRLARELRAIITGPVAPKPRKPRGSGKRTAEVSSHTMELIWANID